MKETQNKPRKPSATAASLLVAICCYLLLFLARLKCPSLSILKWGSGPRWAWRWKHPPSDSPRGSWTVTWLVLVHHGSTMFHYFHSCWKHKWYKCECYVLLVQHFTSRPEGRWRDNRNSFRRLLYPLPCLKLIHCRLFPPCQSQSTSVGEPYTWTLENWGGPWLLLGRQYWGRSCMIQLVHRVLIWSKSLFEEGIIRFGYRVDMLGTRVHRRKRFFAAWFVCWLATILYNYGFFTDHSTGTSKPTRHFVNNTAEQPEQSLEFVSILPGFSLWSRLLWVLHNLHNLPMRFLQSARRCYWR